MRNTKKLGILGVVAVGALGMGACTAEEPEPAVEPVVETPEPSAETEAEASEFGSTTTIELDGSEWEIRLDDPRDVSADYAAEQESYGLDGTPPEGSTFVGVPGTVTKVNTGAADPFSDLDIEAVVQQRIISADGPAVGDALMDVGELLQGGTAEFTEVFVVPAGTKIETVIVAAGMGEASTSVTFGTPVDLAPSDTTSDSPDVESMKYLWNEAPEEAQAESYTAWGLDGGNVTEAGIATLIAEGEEAGVILDEAEAEEFLTWLLEQ